MHIFHISMVTFSVQILPFSYPFQIGNYRPNTKYYILFKTNSHKICIKPLEFILNCHKSRKNVSGGVWRKNQLEKLEAARGA